MAYPAAHIRTHEGRFWFCLPSAATKFRRIGAVGRIHSGRHPAWSTKRSHASCDSVGVPRGRPASPVISFNIVWVSNYSPLLALFVLAPRLRRASGRAVSIFLPARSGGYDARFYDIEFRDLLHRYSHRLSEKDRELMEFELRRLRNHVAVVRPSGCPAFAGFADEPHGVLELIKLRSEVDERLEVGFGHRELIANLVHHRRKGRRRLWFRIARRAHGFFRIL